MYCTAIFNINVFSLFYESTKRKRIKPSKLNCDNTNPFTIFTDNWSYTQIAGWVIIQHDLWTYLSKVDSLHISLLWAIQVIQDLPVTINRAVVLLHKIHLFELFALHLNYIFKYNLGNLLVMFYSKLDK